MDKKKVLLRTVAFIGASISTIAIINKIISEKAVSKNLLYRKEQRFFQSDFGRVFYTKQGTGEPLLLIHDLNSTSSGYEWEAAAEALSSSFTVYNVDLLGFGRSQKPMITYTNFMYVALLHQFIDQVIGSAPIVMTSGKASSLALATERYKPNTFTKLFLINPQSFSDAKISPSKKDIRRKKLLELPVIGTLLYHLIHSKKEIASKALLVDFYNPTNIPEHYVDHCYEACHLGGRRAKAAYCSLISNFINLPVEQFVKQVQIPVSIIGGSMEDSIIDTIDQYVLLNPEINAHILEHAIHLPHLEEPEAFAQFFLSIC